MSIGSLIFSLFLLFAGVCTMVYVVSASANTPAVSDTYGNNISAVDSAANGTYGLTSSMTQSGTATLVFILMIAVVVVICAVGYLYYKTVGFQKR
jgi:hypothetical protein